MHSPCTDSNNASRCPAHRDGDHHFSQHWQKKFFVGIVLISIGVLSFFNYFGMFHLAQPWHIGPLFMVLIGILKMTVYPNIKQFSRGLFLTFLGVWLFAVFEHWLGLTFANSWPLVLIAVGVRIIVESTLKFFFAKERNREE
jgi:hypothetical protein